MEANSNSENDRAGRIAYRINQSHITMANVYENLVDRDFVLAEKDVRELIMEFRFILKSIEEDDF